MDRRMRFRGNAASARVPLVLVVCPFLVAATALASPVVTGPASAPAAASDMAAAKLEGGNPAATSMAAMSEETRPRAPRRPPVQKLEMSVGLATYHDNDILQYSENQIADYESGLHPYRFDLESPDDIVYRPTLTLDWERDQGRGRRHGLHLRGSGELHSRNGSADFRSLGVAWREGFRKGRRFALGYYMVPDYYLRQLYDEDLVTLPSSERYVRAAFDLQIGSVGWRQALSRNARLGVAYQFEQRRYVPNFRERDSGTHQAEIGLSWDGLPRRSAIDLSTALRLSRARAQDGDDTTGTTPDDADLSYHGVGTTIGGRMELARGEGWRLDGDLGYTLAMRSYDSDRPADVYHYGRLDILNAVEAGMRARFVGHWSARVFYRLEDNVARLSTAAPPISDSGSYHQDQIGLALEWRGEVWRRNPAAAADPDSE